MDIKIISGGQTGVDQGALEAAIRAGIAHGGTCPLGRKSEDGVIPVRYELTEHWSDQYPPRTAMNISQSDGTLILVHQGALQSSRGTQLTQEMCIKQRKPHLVLDPKDLKGVEIAVSWLEQLELDIQRVPSVLEMFGGDVQDEPLVLNVAGPRDSRAPGIFDETVKFLGRVLERVS